MESRQHALETAHALTEICAARGIGLIYKSSFDKANRTSADAPRGIGMDKACSMPKMFSEDDLKAMTRLRRAFDPKCIANPGKVLPTPRLCGEVPGPYRAHPLEKAGVAERL